MTTFGKQQSRANTDSRSAGGDLDESAGSKSRINIEQPVAPLVITRNHHLKVNMSTIIYKRRTKPGTGRNFKHQSCRTS